MLLEDTKPCSRCKRELPYDQFQRNASRSDGYHHYCKPCSKAHRALKAGPPRPCAGCGVMFQPNEKDQKVCSHRCVSVPRDQKGAKNYHWKGGEHVGTGGYTYYHMPEHPRAMKSGYVKRADVVIEGLIGRYMRDDEVVHHINHDRLDDSPANLQLMTKAEHHALHGRERSEAAAKRRAEKAATKVAAPRGRPTKYSWPPREELLARVEASGYGAVAAELGCSYSALYHHLRARYRTTTNGYKPPAA